VYFELKNCTCQQHFWLFILAKKISKEQLYRRSGIQKKVAEHGSQFKQ